MFWHPFIYKLQHLLNQLVFVVWTAFLTYKNGPYYTMLEFCRNQQIFGIRKLEYSKEFCHSLHDKVCVITGGTRGIGLEVVRFLFSKGCTIITGTSTLTRNVTADNIQQYQEKLLMQILQTDSIDDAYKERCMKRLVVIPLDLSSMSSVVDFSNHVNSITTKVDYLICNGGVMFVPFRLTGDNFEGHMSINYYSHCLLIVKLLPLLNNQASSTSSQKSRIIVVSSGAHHASFGVRLHDLNSKRLFSVYHSYAQSKLALIMLTYRFNYFFNNVQLNGQDLKNNITINCLHPGVCRTGLMERFNFFKWKLIQKTPLFRSAEEGAETILYTTLSEHVKEMSGNYFENCSLTSSSKLSYNSELQSELWNQTWKDLKPWLNNEEINLLAAV